MPRVEFDGEVHEFPDDFTDSDIAKALKSKPAKSAFADGSVPGLPGSPELAKQKATSKPFEGEGVLDEAGRVVRAVAGPAVKGVAGAGEMALAGITGLASSAANLVAGAGGKELPGVKAPGQSDADLYRATRKNFTYEPRTEGGKEIANSPPMKAVGEFVEKGGKQFGELTGSEGAGELFKDALAVETGAKPVVGAMERIPVGGAAKLPGKPVTSKISETPVESMRAAGVELRPSDVKGVRPETKNPVALAAEKFAGSEASGKAMNLRNQVKFTRFALEEIGAEKGASALTPKTLGKARDPHLATYRETGRKVGSFAPTAEYAAEIDTIRKQKGLSDQARKEISQDLEDYSATGTANGADVVKTISTLRAEARRYRRAKDNVDQNKRGDAFAQAADALENELDRQLSEKGLTDQRAKLQDARTQLAKINDVDESTSAGQIDPQALRRLRDRRGGSPLTGKLNIIADSAEHAPGVAKSSVKSTKAGTADTNPLIGSVLDVGSLGLRPAIRAFMESDFYQNRLGKPAAEIGPEGALSDYFPQRPAPKPPAPKAPSQAPLDLHGPILEQPPGQIGQRPPEYPFTQTELPADALELGPSPEGSLPGGQSPRAAGMAQEVPGTTLYPELRAVRGRPDEVAGELSLAPPSEPFPPNIPRGGSEPPAPGSPGFDLAKDLGIEVVPSAKRPGNFEVSVNGQSGGVAFTTPEEARAAALDIADSLIQDMPEQTPTAPRAANVPNPEGLPPNAFDELFSGNALENNASGESAASAEAISRVAQEKAANQGRYLIDKDGSVIPLTGVDAVDAVAKPGQVIVQRGVGDTPYTVLDRGGLSKVGANNRINMVIDLLNGG